MNTTPYWSDSASLPESPALHGDLEVDVVVIGGGITGITSAYLLGKGGAKVALLERDRFAGVDTGHTSAHLTYVTDERLQELVKNFGRDHAQAVWEAGLAALNRISQTVEEEKIDCEFAWVPGYLHPPLEMKQDEAEMAALREDARLAAELGFDAAYLDSVPFMECPGVRFANQAKFNPRKYLGGLLRALSQAGCHLFEQSEAAEIEIDPPRVRVGEHTIHCKYVVIATHVPLQGARNTLEAALFQTKLTSYSTYVAGAKVPKGSVPEASFWDTADPYFYLRVDRHELHEYAILGGADHKTGQSAQPGEHYARVEKRLLQLFPEAAIDHRWSGQVVETNDGLPFIGEAAERQFIATGFSGNGMTFGTLAAIMACDAYSGVANPWRDLFDPHRKKILGGTWDYLTENKDYPYYMMKRLLMKPEPESLQSVAPGEGRIVAVNGQKLAVYRDEKGTLTAKSAICPHMGCVVRWNGVEKTWDCPCHGSRFHATGEVMAGPAESPLAERPA